MTSLGQDESLELAVGLVQQGLLLLLVDAAFAKLKGFVLSK